MTGTRDEADFAARLADMLRARPGFARRPQDVWTIPVPDGRFPRACVAALVHGSGPETVVLTGHFDTVHIDDYGDLRPLALGLLCRPGLKTFARRPRPARPTNPTHPR